MATEFQTVGPFDEYPDTSHLKDKAGYSEQRGVEEIEKLLKDHGLDFSFRDHIRGLSSIFPGSHPLHFFDGGCGYGETLKGIKKIGGEIGRNVRTEGATKALRHIFQDTEGIDKLILGEVENYLRFRVEKYHHVIDIHGAIQYSNDLVGNEIYEGRTVIPLYAQSLHPGGTALFSMFTLDRELIPYIGPEPRGRAVEILNNNGLKIINEARCYVLVQKTSQG